MTPIDHSTSYDHGQDVDALLPIKKVTAECGFSKTSIYRMMNRGDFPKPLKRQGRSVRWSRAEVQAWIRSEWRPAA